MVNTIFFGTHQFSIFALQSLKNNHNINIVAVVTTVDKKIGRNQILTTNPVKKWAVENNIKVISFQEGKDIFGKIEGIKADLGIIAYFGYLISEIVISKFSKGILNIHPSLLPDYRGASPLEWAILNGETETGVTLIKINEKFDRGEILDQTKIDLDYSKSKTEVYKSLFIKGAELLKNNLDLYLAGKIKLTPQGNSAKTAPKLTKQDGYIDLLKTDENLLKRKILALNPWPSTYTTLQNIADYYKLKPLKDIDTKIIIQEISVKQPKTIANKQTSTPKVEVELLKVQPEGKNIMSWKEFKNGYLK